MPLIALHVPLSDLFSIESESDDGLARGSNQEKHACARGLHQSYIYTLHIIAFRRDSVFRSSVLIHIYEIATEFIYIYMYKCNRVMKRVISMRAREVDGK